MRISSARKLSILVRHPRLRTDLDSLGDAGTIHVTPAQTASFAFLGTAGMYFPGSAALVLCAVSSNWCDVTFGQIGIARLYAWAWFLLRADRGDDWRDFPLPRVIRWGLSQWSALIATGVIWGLWHVPVILFGFEYVAPSALSIPIIVGYAIAGIILG